MNNRKFFVSPLTINSEGEVNFVATVVADSCDRSIYFAQCLEYELDQKLPDIVRVLYKPQQAEFGICASDIDNNKTCVRGYYQFSQSIISPEILREALKAAGFQDGVPPVR